MVTDATVKIPVPGRAYWEQITKQTLKLQDPVPKEEMEHETKLHGILDRPQPGGIAVGNTTAGRAMVIRFFRLILKT